MYRPLFVEVPIPPRPVRSFGGLFLYASRLIVMFKSDVSDLRRLLAKERS